MLDFIEFLEDKGAITKVTIKYNEAGEREVRFYKRDKEVDYFFFTYQEKCKNWIMFILLGNVLNAV